jgi:hypothetical protein
LIICREFIKSRKQVKNLLNLFLLFINISVFIQLKCSSKIVQFITTCIVFKNRYRLVNFVIKAAFKSDFIINIVNYNHLLQRKHQ